MERGQLPKDAKIKFSKSMGLDRNLPRVREIVNHGAEKERLHSLDRFFVRACFDCTFFHFESMDTMAVGSRSIVCDRFIRVVSVRAA